MATLAAGEWLEIEVPNNTFPVEISIDGGEPVKAWIDRVPQYVAKVRVPQLRRGRHGAIAFAGGRQYAVEFEVF